MLSSIWDRGLKCVLAVHYSLLLPLLTPRSLGECNNDDGASVWARDDDAEGHFKKQLFGPYTLQPFEALTPEGKLFEGMSPSEWNAGIKRPGRPWSTTVVKKNPFTTSSQEKNTLQEVDVSLSKSTIKRRLHKSKYRGFNTRCKQGQIRLCQKTSKKARPPLEKHSLDG